jgi:hypothetical protein
MMMTMKNASLNRGAANVRSEGRAENPFPIILAIDPSMHNLGFACHNLNLGCDRYDIDSDAWRFGLIHPRAQQTEPQYRWRNAFAKLKKNVGWWPTHLASEWPSYFATTKGKIAATMGYTIDLAGMTAYIAGRFGMRADYITLWKPEQWKGMVPKHVTQQKFIRLYGKAAESIVRNYSHDVIDAIMIAEYWLTLYHREKFRWMHQRS